MILFFVKIYLGKVFLPLAPVWGGSSTYNACTCTSWSGSRPSRSRDTPCSRTRPCTKSTWETERRGQRITFWPPPLTEWWRTRPSWPGSWTCAGWCRSWDLRPPPQTWPLSPAGVTWAWWSRARRPDWRTSRWRRATESPCTSHSRSLREGEDDLSQ